MIPSAKVTTQSITAVVVAIVTAVALHLFDVEWDDATVNMIAGAVGWVVSFVAGYLKAETRPAPSSLARR